MTTYLTGNITENRWGCNGDVITSAYGFCEELKMQWKPFSRCLFICSDPADYSGNDGALIYYRDCFARTGFSFSTFDLVDYRYIQDFTFEKLASYDVILLGSGRVPLQGRFFNELNLREFFRQARENLSFDGIVIGISAGALNCANVTYSWPEEAGDSYQSEEERFYPGLDLVKTQVLPHFQARHDMYVDGRHLYSDITVEDSKGHLFVAIPDYSYVVARNGVESIVGPYSYYENGVYYDVDSLRKAA